MTDQTASDASLYGSRQWVADTLGMKLSTFDNKRVKLEEQGFPQRDHLVGLYLKADVLAWVSRRRQLADSLRVTTQQEEVTINDERL